MYFTLIMILILKYNTCEVEDKIWLHMTIFERGPRASSPPPPIHLKFFLFLRGGGVYSVPFKFIEYVWTGIRAIPTPQEFYRAPVNSWIRHYYFICIITENTINSWYNRGFRVLSPCIIADFITSHMWTVYGRVRIISSDTTFAL